MIDVDPTIEGRSIEELYGVNTLECREDFDINLGFGINVTNHKIVCSIRGDNDVSWGQKVPYPGGRWKEMRLDRFLFFSPETVFGSSGRSVRGINFRWEHGANCVLITDTRQRLVEGSFEPYDELELQCEPNIVPKSRRS